MPHQGSRCKAIAERVTCGRGADAGRANSHDPSEQFAHQPRQPSAHPPFDSLLYTHPLDTFQRPVVAQPAARALRHPHWYISKSQAGRSPSTINVNFSCILVRQHGPRNSPECSQPGKAVSTKEPGYFAWGCLGNTSSRRDAHGDINLSYLIINTLINSQEAVAAGQMGLINWPASSILPRRRGSRRLNLSRS